jgi:ribosomal protein S18 acetylase RimI-like enzyme
VKTFDVRRARPGDERSLSLLGQATMLQTYAGIISSRNLVDLIETEQTREEYRALLLDPGVSIWLAEIEPGQAVVGYLALAPRSESETTDDAGKAVLEIKRLHVLHRFHRNGLGGRLVDEAIKEARLRKADKLVLVVNALNEEAIQFYRTYGFQKIGDTCYRAGDKDYPCYLFALEVIGPEAG